MNKNIIIILTALIVIGGVFLLVGNYLNFLPTGNGEKTAEEIQREKEEERKQNYSDSYKEIVLEDYFSFPSENVVSFGEVKDLEGQIGKYEDLAKDKEALLLVEYNAIDGQEREAYIKTLDLNNENISYVLRHYTNYFEVNDIEKIEYRFKFSIDEFKKEEYKKETNSGTILISNNKIYVIMSNDDTIDHFLQILSEYNSIDETFLQYLQNNPSVYIEIKTETEKVEQKEQEVINKIPDDLKVFASNFWKEWIVMNTEELPNYYSDEVWFYAGDEWFDEWDMEYDDSDEVHEFVNIELGRLLSAYVELKSEDFEEDYEEALELSDSIILYPIDDFMSLCFSEDKDEFFSHFNISDGDVIMTVRLDSGDTCTIDGNFLGGELRFFVISGTGGDYEVVTDFTE